MLHILSDLHLWGDEELSPDPLAHAVERYLKEQVSSGDWVILAGDIFDVFVGPQPLYERRYRRTLQAIRDLGLRGISVHYIEGNHDFRMSSVFKDDAHVRLYSDEIVLDWEGEKFYIAHGDLVDDGDYGYLALRAFLRSAPIDYLAGALPGKIVDWLGSRSNSYSRGAKPLLPEHLPETKLLELRSKYRSFAEQKLMQGFDTVILGHCHDLDDQTFKVGTRVRRYFNMGYPRVHGYILRWSKTGGVERVRIL